MMVSYTQNLAVIAQVRAIFTVMHSTGLIAAALFIEIMMGHTTNSLGVSVV